MTNPLPPLSPEIRAQLERLDTDYHDGVFATSDEFAEAAYRLRDAEVQRLQEEIWAAKEECPVSRMQDYLHAPLLAVVKEQVSQCFRYQSRAESAEALLAETRAELERVKEARDWSNRKWRAIAERAAKVGELKRYNCDCLPSDVPNGPPKDDLAEPILVERWVLLADDVEAALSPAPAVPPQEG